MASSKECFRIALWMCWVTNMLFTTIYYLLSGVTAFKLVAAANQIVAKDAKTLVLNRVWRAPIAATGLAALLVFGFNMFSCCILIKKSLNRSGPGFGYGFMVAFCFTLSFFSLLVGLIMDSFREVVHTTLEGKVAAWSKYTTELFIGTEVFAFLCFVLFILFFLALVIFQSAVSDQLGITQAMSNPYVPLDVPAAVPLGAGLAAGGAAGLGMDGKAPSSSDPQYAQFGTADYDQNTYNQYNQYNQYYQQPSDYQNTTEYQTNEYNYDQEQGTYQAAPYDNTYAANGSHQNTPPYSASPVAGAYAAPAYTATDYSSASAAAFHGAQGAYTAPSGHPRNEQQL